MTLSRSLLFLAIICLFACSSDDAVIPDDNDVAPGTPGSITCMINGDGFSASGVLATGVITFSGDFYGIALAGVDFFGQDTVGLALAISGNGFSTLMEGQVVTGEGDIVNIPLAAGEVNINQRPSKEITASSLETEVATITITSLDTDLKLISGTFSFEGLDPDSNTSIIVSQGDFTEIPYD